MEFQNQEQQKKTSTPLNDKVITVFILDNEINEGDLNKINLKYQLDNPVIQTSTSDPTKTNYFYKITTEGALKEHYLVMKEDKNGNKNYYIGTLDKANATQIFQALKTELDLFKTATFGGLNNANNNAKIQQNQLEVSQPKINEDVVNLENLLSDVKSGEKIPAFDVDNTLSLANKGFNIFEYIFRKNEDIIEDNKLPELVKELKDIYSDNNLNQQYFTLNLEQIALNYPEYEDVIAELQQSIKAIEPSDSKEADFIGLVSTLRTKVIALRKEEKEIPNDLFIAPLAKEFLNQVKEGEQDKVIIASVAFCAYDPNNLKNDLKLIYEKAFGTKQNCSIYVPMTQNLGSPPSWHKFTIKDDKEEFEDTNLKVMTDKQGIMQKSQSLQQLALQSALQLGDKKILHIDNEAIYKNKDLNNEKVEFLHFPHQQLPLLDFASNEKETIINQEMPSKGYSENIFQQLQKINDFKEDLSTIATDSDDKIGIINIAKDTKTKGELEKTKVAKIDSNIPINIGKIIADTIAKQQPKNQAEPKGRDAIGQPKNQVQVNQNQPKSRLARLCDYLSSCCKR